MLATKPIEGDADSQSELFEEIKELVFWENAGFKTDWSCYDFAYMKLYAAWRDAERKIQEAREIRLQNTLSGLLKVLPALFRIR